MVINRRDLLRALLAGAAFPLRHAGAAVRPSVGIIGGGIAGVSLAWLLDGARDVVLLEAQDSLGGNIHGVEVDLGGEPVVVDMGAQYFHPGVYPAYTALLRHLGLHTPDSPDTSATHGFPASFTLRADAELVPRYVSPFVPGRLWPLAAPWNLEGLLAFGVAFFAAARRERLNESWALTMDEWLPTLGLSRRQREGMVLPWAASLFSGSIDQTRGLSARAAMIFAAKALPADPLEPIVYYVLKQGMGEVLRRLVQQCSTVNVLTSTKVQHVSREGDGTFTVRCANGQHFRVDDLVFASSGPGAARLLEGMPLLHSQLAAVRGIEFYPSRLALHTDALYAASNLNLRSFLNSHIEGAFCEASMWLTPVLGVPDSATLWKSWVTHRSRQPRQPLYEIDFMHMLPTPATLLAQDSVRAMQGQDRVWFAGGYLSPYDSQETALRSALRVAAGLQVPSERSQLLLDSLDPAEEL